LVNGPPKKECTQQVVDVPASVSRLVAGLKAHRELVTQDVFDGTSFGQLWHRADEKG
jgi:hypothetical protein